MSVKVNRARSRPRFKKGKQRGRNLQRHPRGQQWSRDGGVAVPLASDWIGSRRPDRREAAGSKEYLGYRVRQRGALKNRLGRRSDRELRRAKAGREGNEARIRLESRVDLVRHRCGLANSVLQARERVRLGWLSCLRDGEVRPVRQPSRQVEVGDRIRVEPKRWSEHQSSVVESQWKGWSNASEEEEAGRGVPNYLEVNWRVGAVVRVKPAEVGELRVPADRGLLDAVRGWSR